MHEEPTAPDRSAEAERVIDRIRADIYNDRSCGFDRALIAYIDANPHLTFRQCWEAVEEKLARESGVRPRVYSYRFDS